MINFRKFGAVLVLAATLGIVEMPAANAAPEGEAGTAALRCTSGYFCAYDHAGFSGRILYSRLGRCARYVEVADNRVSSGSNNTGNQWVGRGRRTGWPDYDVFKFNAGTEYSYVGNENNDEIDHFDVRPC